MTTRLGSRALAPLAALFRCAVAALVLAAPLAPPPALADSQAQTAPRSHDWRIPGFAGAVGGQLFDPDCVPLRSAGSNVPNLPYRAGLQENLEWMRRHSLRWLRVFATGHSLDATRLPRDAGAAAAALRTLLAGVEAFNAAHDARERIYVLVALTDYYPPGVPGDRHAFDHPAFRAVPVLPAPWYRAGVRQFDFVQEHNLGRVTGMPNYEVYYKPWVRTVVASVADSPALLGWQLGNELKARGSSPNAISSAQAYEWYLAFTRDIVDTIRAHDRHHLIFMGAQYAAELVDWPYRSGAGGSPVATLVPEYRSLVARALAACEGYCWNVWGLTNYDFELYALDDAALVAEAGVAAVMTEYGFTLGSAAEMQQRFGGDRAAALRAGLDRPWVDLQNRTQPRRWAATDLVARAPLAGLAPWASPAPEPNAGFDLDEQRGITGVPERPLPDAAALWTAWGEVAAHLEAANRAAGVSPGCLGFVSALAPVPTAGTGSAAGQDCPVSVVGGFRTLLEQDPELWRKLGCAAYPERPSQVVEQVFERGRMLWHPDPWRPNAGRIVATFDDGTWRRFADTYRVGESQPPVTAPPGLVAPVRGFGKVWGEVPGVRERLGWAVAPEQSRQGVVQDFAGGALVWIDAGAPAIRTLLSDGTAGPPAGLAPLPAPTSSSPTTACGLVLGFATLHDLVGADVVGACLEDERFNPENGNAEQRTAGGLLVWRKADNWTAFTDGHRTWINGPHGLAERPNTERLPWEADS